MRRMTLLCLIGAAACGGGKTGGDAGRADAPAGEGLVFPDRGGTADRPGFGGELRFLRDGTPDGPRDGPRGATERPPDQPSAPDAAPDQAPPDLFPGDSWPGGACFYQWSKWSCSTVLYGCSATCGGGTAQITCLLTSCSCKKATGSKPCSASGSGCTRCATAFNAGCCNF